MTARRNLVLLVASRHFTATRSHEIRRRSNEENPFWRTVTCFTLSLTNVGRLHFLESRILTMKEESSYRRGEETLVEEGGNMILNNSALTPR